MGEMTSRWVFAALAGCLAATSAWAAPASMSAPAASLPGDEALVARYALPHSRFMAVDGERLHYVDEGHGPAILLVHGSFSSLLAWNDWARTLVAQHFRVIRFDESPLGLSGPNPAGDYSIARRLHLIDTLMDRLGVARFAIVGTSSSGVPVAAYAAARPQRVRAVVLSNIAVGALQFDPTGFSPALKAALAEDATHPAYHKPEFWHQVMVQNMADKDHATPALAQEWTDLDNRALRLPDRGKAAEQASSALRTPEDLRAITAPTLLLWSQQDHETTIAGEGQRALALLGATDKALVAVPDCGHLMALDCPARSLALALPFLRRTR